ncbi:related to 3-(3-Hydroxyphenyl)propionate 2-hydroxylase [Fusarium fujikuroi]|nr:related to 3-(3-Hydroxyphenyl)propionate 2-hydroxylase [Fusarium fujikuroi]
MSSPNSNFFPVIIVGAGPVGLITAVNLAKLNVPVLILERNHQVDQSPRAAVYQPCAQAELLESGTLDDVRKESVLNDVMTFWKNKERVASITKTQDADVFPAGLNCPQPKLAKILVDHLLKKYNAEIKFCQKVIRINSDAGQDTVEVVTLDTNTNLEIRYTCHWLVGADGAGSTVRRLSDITFDGFSWPKEDFVATNVRFDFMKHGFSTANFIMDPVHWSVVCILDDAGLWRCAFGVKAGMTNDEIRSEIDEHYKHLSHLIRDVPRLSRKEEFCWREMLLINNPIGGLGLTTGLLDAGPLGRALGAVINGRAPEDLLDYWANARRDKWLTFTNAFSIENKRMIQMGGYSEDPLGIWADDEVAKEHNMEKWVRTATPEKRREDTQFHESLADLHNQDMVHVRQWSITLDPRWMEEYEDPEVVKYRISLRPDRP